MTNTTRLISILLTLVLFSAATFAVPASADEIVINDTSELGAVEVPEPSESTSEDTTAKEPAPSDTTTEKPKPTDTTTEKPADTTAKEPDTPSESTETKTPPTTDKREPADSTSKKPKPTDTTASKKPAVKTDKADKTEKTEDETDETSETAETSGESVFSEKKAFSSPLEVISFVLGIAVIISAFIALFTIARRIVKKYTSGK